MLSSSTFRTKQISDGGVTIPGTVLSSLAANAKVQRHCVSLVAGPMRQDTAIDLEALADKTAPTLCTSIERIVRSVCEGVPVKPDHELWLPHVLIGDGIATNGAAAKQLWSTIQAQPLGGRIRYLLWLVRCATHSAALSTKTGVIGGVAKHIGFDDGDLVTTTSVRLYKYVINDYYEDFVISVRAWVSDNLVVWRPDAATNHGQIQARRQADLRTAGNDEPQLITVCINDTQ